MAKRQKLSSCHLDELPDEVILKIVGFLDLKELLLCGQVSKRLRAIANDESLWLKLNFWNRKVPYDFIEKAAKNGCQYLSLRDCDILNFTGKSESFFNLKYLNVYNGQCLQRVHKLIQNCSFLQKLSVDRLSLGLDDIQYICQSGQTLQVLDLGKCNFGDCNQTKLLHDLFSNCAHLTELDISHTELDITHSYLLDPHIQALVDNLTPTILKVSLERQGNLQDEHVKKLVKRCNNITHLDLSMTSITNNSVHSIIKQLKASLEKLDVSRTNVDFATLLELKSMPALKTLICFDSTRDHSAVIEYLTKQLPHTSINVETNLYIAKSFKIMEGSDGTDWIWEISAKEQKLFAKVDYDIDDSDFSYDSNDNDDCDDSNDSNDNDDSDYEIY